MPTEQIIDPAEVRWRYLYTREVAGFPTIFRILFGGMNRLVLVTVNRHGKVRIRGWWE